MSSSELRIFGPLIVAGLAIVGFMIVPEKTFQLFLITFLLVVIGVWVTIYSLTHRR